MKPLELLKREKEKVLHERIQDLSNSKIKKVDSLIIGGITFLRKYSVYVSYDIPSGYEQAILLHWRLLGEEVQKKLSCKNCLLTFYVYQMIERGGNVFCEFCDEYLLNEHEL